MDSVLDNTSVLVEREAPKIGGSTAAFYVLIIVLVVVIVIATTAVVFLVIEEKAHDRQPRSDRARIDSRFEVENPSQRRPRKWYNRILGLSGSTYRDSEKETTKLGRRGEGWIQAKSADDWDSESGDELTIREAPHPGPSSTLTKAKEYEPSLNTRRSSTAYTSSPRSRVDSLASDRSSSLRYDPHGVRGLSYPDVYAPTPQRTIPSIQSQLHSPPSSSPSSPSLRHQPSWVLSTVSTVPVRVSISPAPMSASPVSIVNMPSEDSTTFEGGRPKSSTSMPSVRTFERGTKFIEAL